MHRTGPAPIALFVYNRPVHTERTLAALIDNASSSDTEAFVFSDGARSAADETKVAAVRSLIRSTRGFRRVELIERAQNLGLARSIIAGVTDLVRRFGRVIVIEDDLLTSRHFLRYMNDGLDTYADDDRVASIHGYCYPVPGTLPETFFLRGGDCWGWATWERAWTKFEPDGRVLLAQLKARRLTRAFNANGARAMTRMLEDQVAGRNDSWAIRWHASAFLHDMLTLYPGRSLVDNIGLDNSGTHCGSSATFRVGLEDAPVRVRRIPLEENEDARMQFEEFFRARGTRLAQLRELWSNGGFRAVFRRLVPARS